MDWSQVHFRADGEIVPDDLKATPAAPRGKGRAARAEQTVEPPARARTAPAAPASPSVEVRRGELMELGGERGYLFTVEMEGLVWPGPGEEEPLFDPWSERRIQIGACGTRADGLRWVAGLSEGKVVVADLLCRWIPARWADAPRRCGCCHHHGGVGLCDVSSSLVLWMLNVKALYLSRNLAAFASEEVGRLKEWQWVMQRLLREERHYAD